MTRLKQAFLLGCLAAIVGAGAAVAGDVVTVWNSSRFLTAVRDANANPAISRIVVQRPFWLHLTAPIVYSGGQSLRIDGAGARITGDNDPVAGFDLFRATGGGDLKLTHLRFAGGHNGIHVDVPNDAKGRQRLELVRVEVSDALKFGVHLDDLDGSAAGVSLIVESSRIVRNGGVAVGGDAIPDADGIRVDERGPGGITAGIVDTAIDGNGGDGLELDEAGDGDVRLSVLRSTFDRNGAEDPNDLDDGIDIDEADNGDVWFAFIGGSVNGNHDEGIDLDEAGAGGIHAVISRVTVSGNHDEGVKISEANAGDVVATLTDVTADGNGVAGKRRGVHVAEAKSGSLRVVISRSVIVNSGAADIAVDQTGAGAGDLRLNGTTYGRRDGKGVGVTETP